MNTTQALGEIDSIEGHFGELCPALIRRFACAARQHIASDFRSDLSASI
jgi:hypothetical protein